ncbi:uncharacterized protein K460DRAFT_361968 [Cucurbitaria berberidis CBS 394.84]|uniref:Uncharacterized protein n=1 Tax=Cucurbitaria berberidis CBS 394.84 TaxID=1168544 RepID=A0A9P4GTT1_9PLEO|nr:uncharacterized protein K460DRAFT_361968 [Cucurbitaria berberidis CBS 394.84]KAF1851202.1 hypothetical protein K460DRAFT_361968 [Cucurbitaria berberidis CBS 394.84]
MSYRPQKGFSKGYRSHPYGASPNRQPTNHKSNSFDPDSESLNAAGLHASPSLELARSDPFHHYIICSGYFRGKTLAEVHLIKPDYLPWMRSKHYDALPDTHIIRKALDQWEKESGSETSHSWSLPPISSAPSRFRQDNGSYHIYMSERFLKKTWKTTRAELEAVGANSIVSHRSKTQSKKFALFHVYEYAKGPGGMSTAEADKAAATEMARITKSRANYRRFTDQMSNSFDDDDCDFDCCDL